MDGPERLEDDGRRGRRGAGVLVGVVVLVVVALGAVRLSGVLPGPTPSSPGPTPALLTPPAWPRGIGSGTLYVLDAAGVATVDLGSGLVERSRLNVGSSTVHLTAGGPGVLVWYDDAADTPRLVTAGFPDTSVVGPVLARGQYFLPGPDSAVWFSSDLSTSGDRSTWRLADVDDDVVERSVRVSGFVQGDGAGGLLAIDDAGVHRVAADGSESAWRGTVGAVGPDGYEAQRCAVRRCQNVLHDDATGVETPLAAITSTDLDGASLSPGNRFAASVQPAATDDSSLVVRVTTAGASRELRSFPASEEETTPPTWLSDRWLAAVSAEGLVLYDAVDDRLVVPDLGLTLPTQVVRVAG